MDALSDIPLFPLPGHVLLPGLPVPYHIFEPRYRALVADLERRPEGERFFAVPRIRSGHERDAEGRPPLHAVVTLACLMSTARLPDDRSLIVAVGEGRWHLDELPSAHPYRLAHLARIPEPAVTAESLAGPVVELARRVLGCRHGIPDEIQALLDPQRHPAPLVLDRLASLVLVDPDLRQRYLEAASPVCRLRILAGSECRSSGRLSATLN